MLAGVKVGVVQFQENRCTPRIDAVLHQYRQRATQKTERRRVGQSGNEGGPDTPQIPLAEKINGPSEPSYESRLIELEEQLAALLTRSSSKVQQVNFFTHIC